MHAHYAGPTVIKGLSAPISRRTRRKRREERGRRRPLFLRRECTERQPVFSPVSPPLRHARPDCGRSRSGGNAINTDLIPASCRFFPLLVLANLRGPPTTINALKLAKQAIKMAKAPPQFFTLSDGRKIPSVGLGTVSRCRAGTCLGSSTELVRACRNHCERKGELPSSTLNVNRADAVPPKPLKTLPPSSPIQFTTATPPAHLPSTSHASASIATVAVQARRGRQGGRDRDQGESSRVADGGIELWPVTWHTTRPPPHETSTPFHRPSRLPTHLKSFANAQAGYRHIDCAWAYGMFRSFSTFLRRSEKKNREERSRNDGDR